MNHDVIPAMVDLMESHARLLKSKLPAEHQAIIDAIIAAERIRLRPDRIIVSELRGMAMRFFPDGSPVIAALMDNLADKIDQNTRLNH